MWFNDDLEALSRERSMEEGVVFIWSLGPTPTFA
jgi:hypothetical protein